jgi:precorrin-3B synthase
VWRPWPAEDGLLVRIRLIGGRISAAQVEALADVSQQYGDGDVHLTGRANLQVRGLPGSLGALPSEVASALEATGLVPSRTHELIRNVMVSPQTGLAGGRADLRPIAMQLDHLLCVDPDLAGLPGRFLFVLDDGRGDLIDRTCDLGLVALDGEHAQLRVGSIWGRTVTLEAAPREVAALAHRFLAVRGEGPTAPWHVSELSESLVSGLRPDPEHPSPSAPLPFGEVPGGRHLQIRDGVLDSETVHTLTGTDDELIVTPWHGVLIPETIR